MTPKSQIVLPDLAESRRAFIREQATPLQTFVYLHQDRLHPDEWRERLQKLLEEETDIARMDGHRDCLLILRRVNREEEFARELLVERRAQYFRDYVFRLPPCPEPALKPLLVNIWMRLKRTYVNLGKIDA